MTKSWSKFVATALGSLIIILSYLSFHFSPSDLLFIYRSISLTDLFPLSFLLFSSRFDCSSRICDVFCKSLYDFTIALLYLQLHEPLCLVANANRQRDCMESKEFPEAFRAYATIATSTK